MDKRVLRANLLILLILLLMVGITSTVIGGETEKTKSSPTEMIAWGKIFGGERIDIAHSIQQTSDGGYIVAAETFSFGSGKADAYIIRLDSKGDMIWKRMFGGKESDGAASILQTSDGGYVVAGSTHSFGAGKADAYIIKLDSKGNKVWEKMLGGKEFDNAQAIQQTSDGGYIVAGSTYSFGSGKGEAYIIKLDSKGNKVWEKMFKGNGSAKAHSIQQSSDGGYIFAGSTYSFAKGEGGAYIVKLDSKGNKVWEKMFGGKGSSLARDIQQTSDGGYVAAGQISSIEPGKGDAYIIKLDSKGEKVWEKRFGIKDLDASSFVSGKELKGANINSIYHTSDGGYIVALYTYSKLTIEDAYIIRLDSEGKKIWEKTIGLKELDKESAELYKGSAQVYANSIRQTSDYGYIIAGGITDPREGKSDIYIIKTDPNGKVH